MSDMLHIATIVKPQGIRGEVKVLALTDSAEDLAGYKRVFIDGKEYKILRVRPQADCAFITLSGVADRNAAELLRGKFIFSEREDAPDLPEGRYFIVDVIGCKVVTEEGDWLGNIVEITPARTDVYVLDREGTKVVFAAAEGVIEDIDTAAGVVTVNGRRFAQSAFTE